MKYPDGQDVRLGDQVRLGDAKGRVVAALDDDAYTPDFPRENWVYLNRGVMIEFDKFGLLHYEEPEPDLELVARG